MYVTMRHVRIKRVFKVQVAAKADAQTETRAKQCLVLTERYELTHSVVQAAM